MPKSTAYEKEYLVEKRRYVRKKKLVKILTVIGNLLILIFYILSLDKV